MKLQLVQEDKCHLDGSDPELQLIAEVLAAFAANNEMRERTLGLLPHQFNLTMPVPLVIMLKGTSPAFYKISVSTTLATAVLREG